MNEKANVSKELNAKHRKVSSLVSSLSVLMLCSFFVVGFGIISCFLDKVSVFYLFLDSF
ncbi:hypothetical protein OIU84_002395 [Salix udensis]|uniref:Uncharacterized protein n=1 Tax=Salix udensis TaxID=889485 RepID=A0AAD6K3W9_9ROSI|nr:hypothetical protein OIU84_002395 [Salix udensis]